MPKFADYLKRAVAPGYVSNEVDAALDMEMQILALVEGSLISSNAVDRFGNDVTTPEGWTEFFLHFPDVFHYLKSFANDAANFAPVTDEEKAEAASGNLKRGSNTRRVVGAKA